MEILVYINFCYFLLLAYIWYRKYGLNISVYSALLYSVTAFFSCLLISGKSREYYLQYTNIEPTLVYWLLLTIVMYPFNKLKMGKPIILGNALRLYKIIGWTHIILFFLVLFLLASDVVTVITSGDIGSMRVSGSGVGISQMDSSLGRAFIISFSELSIMMLPFYMYGVTHLNLSKKFIKGVLISSFSILVLGMSYVDRSKTFFYLIIFGLSFVIFKSYFTEKQKRRIFIPAAIGFVLLVSYLLFVTTQRFGGGDDAESSIISYAGQSYLNFCRFYESYTPLYTNYHLFFPVTCYFLIDGYNGMVGVGVEVFEITGEFINVFYTFLGSVLVDSGKFGMILFAILLFLLETIVVNLCKGNKVKFSAILVLFIVSIIPTCGIISYYYSEPIKTVGVYFWLFVCYIMSRKISLK